MLRALQLLAANNDGFAGVAIPADVAAMATHVNNDADDDDDDDATHASTDRSMPYVMTTRKTRRASWCWPMRTSHRAHSSRRQRSPASRANVTTRISRRQQRRDSCFGCAPAVATGETAAGLAYHMCAMCRRLRYE